MSRSYKKHPVLSNACAASEKSDKALAHRGHRAAFRVALAKPQNLADVEFDERNEAHSNVFTFAKDGRHWTSLRVAHQGRALRVLDRPTWLGGAPRHAHKVLGK